MRRISRSAARKATKAEASELSKVKSKAIPEQVNPEPVRRSTAHRSAAARPAPRASRRNKSGRGVHEDRFIDMIRSSEEEEVRAAVRRERRDRTADEAMQWRIYSQSHARDASPPQWKRLHRPAFT